MNTSFAHTSKHFLVYFNYKRELNAYSKRLFDPFCRRERIMFQARGLESFVTTVGQLNFFRWFIEKEILEYVTENREAIEKDMNSRNSTSKRKEIATDNSKTRKKREELSISACKCIKKEIVEIVVKFS